MSQPSVSVVIPAGRDLVVNRCIESIFGTKYDELEIIVVVRPGHTYSHPDSRVRVVEQDGKGVSNARNCGIRESRGKFIAFTDDDCVVSPGWLNYLLAPFENPEMGGTGSIREANNSMEPLASMWDLSYIRMGGLKEKYRYLNAHDTYLCTSSAVFRADIIKALGGFDEILPSGEDYDLSRRVKDAGFRIALVPEARVRHDHPATWKSMIRQQLWFARGDIELARKYGKKGIRLRLLLSVPLYSAMSLPVALKLEGIGKKLVFPVFVFIRCASRFAGSVIYHG